MLTICEIPKQPQCGLGRETDVNKTNIYFLFAEIADALTVNNTETIGKKVTMFCMTQLHEDEIVQ